MTAFVIADIEVTDKDLYQQVIERTPAIVAQYGGTYIARGGETYFAHGDWQPKRLTMLRFESMEAARRWESSPEYTAVKAIRDKSARVNMVIVEGRD